jgi:hypothetical protein
VLRKIKENNMAGTLHFPINDDFKAIVEHAEMSEPGLYYGTKIGKSLYLVKDSGVYLMSAGSPGLRRPVPAGEQHASQVVVYADGHDPTIEDTWDIDHDVCGGDDFAEPIEIDVFRRIIDEGATACIIKMSATSFEILSQK